MGIPSKIRVGDRFRYETGNIWEVTRPLDDDSRGEMVVIYGVTTATGTHGTFGHASYFEDNHEYLGNFAKSHQFKNIYKILNNEM
jgi:hypothetical protein